MMDGHGADGRLIGDDLAPLLPAGLTYFLPWEEGREYRTSFRIAVIPYHHHETSVHPSARQFAAD